MNKIMELFTKHKMKIVSAVILFVVLIITASCLTTTHAKQASGSPFKNYSQSYNRDYLKTVNSSKYGKKLGSLKKPAAIWVGTWDNNITKKIDNEVTYAKKNKRIPVFVVYAIPGLDCGQGGGGGYSPSEYKKFIRNAAAGVKGRPAVFIVEPDALAHIGNCNGGKKERIALLRYAIDKLSRTGSAVYLDAGHSNWHSSRETANRIKAVGTRGLRGFSVNVSNYQTTSNSVKFGNSVAKLTGLHYVIDTSRNGNGPSSEGDYWCNGSGARVGNTFRRGSGWLDATLWIKPPGESDGYCKGGPKAGDFFHDYAYKLVHG